jgi:hypothetical protein
VRISKVAYDAVMPLGLNTVQGAREAGLKNKERRRVLDVFPALYREVMNLLSSFCVGFV